MADPPDWFQPSRDLRVPFIFVPHGAPDPVEWKAAHPEWVKFPATFVPRAQSDETPQDVPAAAMHTEQPEWPPEVMAASSHRPEPPQPDPLDRFDPVSPGFDAVATLQLVGYLAQPPAGAPPAGAALLVYVKGRGDERSDTTGNPPGIDATPVPLRDDKGNPVIGASGKPALRPAGLDPHFFVKLGEALANEPPPRTDDNASSGQPDAFVEAYAKLRFFKQGGKWDAQRVGGKKHPEFLDVSTIYIGLYAASAGLSLSTTLEIENLYAGFKSHFAPGTKMSEDYPKLPETNVINTRIGYELYRSGRIGTGAAD